jgi:hypothetical protein
MKFLLTVDDLELDPVTGVSVGTTISGVGTYSFEPGVPLEVENDFVAEKVREQLWYAGVVEIPMTKDKWKGLTLDVPSAVKESEALVLAAHQTQFKQYKESQIERAKDNKPAVMPEGRVALIVKHYNIDLAAHGLRTVGANPFEASGQNSQQNGVSDVMVAALKEENKELKENMLKLSAIVEGLAAKRGPGRPRNDESQPGA